MDNILNKALEFYRLGVSTIPVPHMQKKPVIRWSEYQERLPSSDELIRWFSVYPTNWGVICGRLHHLRMPGFLVVIDFDQLDRALDWLNRGIVRTRMITTSRGLHAYFFTREDPGKTMHFPELGFDLVAQGAYVIGAESVHPSGAVYQVLDSSPVAWVNRVRDVLPEIPAVQVAKTRVVIPAPVQADSSPWASAENPPDLIQAIKARYRILDFFPDAERSSYGRQDDFYLARCPFHDDHNPSFWINARLNLCGCYAGCTSKPYDVINLVARLEGISNQNAIHLLGQRLRGGG